MRRELIREPSGNVVLRSGVNAIRFIQQYGGSPNQWFREPFPMITNDFPGSGVSTQWDNGQDPTQAGANGLLPFPVATLDGRDKNQNYYYREFILADYIYGTTGTPPIFWLSSEWVDDAIAPNPLNENQDTGWRTLYNPKQFAPWLVWKERPVIFEGRPGCTSGLMFIGDEIRFGGPWNKRLWDTGKGRIAFKIRIGMEHSHRNAFAGILFRKDVPDTEGLDKHGAYAAPGLHWYIYRNGEWSLNSMNNGSLTQLKKGKFSKSQVKLLLKTTGLEVEARTYNQAPNKVDLYAEGVLITTVILPNATAKGPHFALFGSTNSGWIAFCDRQVFDTGIDCSVMYKSLGDGSFESTTRIYKAPGCDEERFLYRAGMPGVFLNQTTFVGNDRTCKGKNKESGLWEDIDGIYPLFAYDEYFAGNIPGNVGIRLKVLECVVDDKVSEQAHLLISKHQINDEFVIGLNPLPPESRVFFDSLRMKIRWDTELG